MYEIHYERETPDGWESRVVLLPYQTKSARAIEYANALIRDADVAGDQVRNVSVLGSDEEISADHLLWSEDYLAEWPEVRALLKRAHGTSPTTRIW